MYVCLQVLPDSGARSGVQPRVKVSNTQTESGTPEQSGTAAERARVHSRLELVQDAAARGGGGCKVGAELEEGRCSPRAGGRGALSSHVTRGQCLTTLFIPHPKHAEGAPTVDGRCAALQ